MCLSHMGVQQYTSVIESNALLIVAQLVVDGSNEQQYISLVGVDKVHLQPCHICEAKRGEMTSESREVLVVGVCGELALQSMLK